MNSRSPLSKLPSDLIGIAMIAVLSLGLGLLLNHFRASPLPLTYASKAERMEAAVTNVITAASNSTPAPEPAIAAVAEAGPVSIQRITLEEFRQGISQPGHLVLDARPEIFHRLGHVPGALALPRDEFDAYYEKNRKSLEAFKDQPLLIYCQGESCEDSELVANALAKLGFKKISIFGGGWSEWTREHLPEQRS